MERTLRKLEQMEECAKALTAMAAEDGLCDGQYEDVSEEVLGGEIDRLTKQIGNVAGMAHRVSEVRDNRRARKALEAAEKRAAGAEAQA